MLPWLSALSSTLKLIKCVLHFLGDLNPYVWERSSNCFAIGSHVVYRNLKCFDFKLFV